MLAVFAHPDDESFGPGGTLARYADNGVEVHVATATDGVAGSVAQGYEHTKQDLVNVRRQELESAAQILGVQLHMLGYRDSGYIGDPSNTHPEAFINRDAREEIARVVGLLREVRPQVVVTHDSTGGYFHPDHIRCWEITTAAFHAAGDPARFPDVGPAPYVPQRLYYTAFSNRWVRLFTTLLRLRGKDPTRMGRNQDIDFTKLGIPTRQIHARIDYRRYWDVRRAAAAQHLSQGGGTSGSRMLPEWLQRRYLAKDQFIRAYPVVPDGYQETDFFAGVALD